jgi:hypothetical protein
MEPKVILSTAWAERLKFSEQELAQLFDIDLDSAVPANDGMNCPRCGNTADDSNYQFFKYRPITTPDNVEGMKYVGCVCGTVYVFGFKTTRGYISPEMEQQG